MESTSELWRKINALWQETETTRESIRITKKDITMQTERTLTGQTCISRLLSVKEWLIMTGTNWSRHSNTIQCMWFLWRVSDDVFGLMLSCWHKFCEKLSRKIGETDGVVSLSGKKNSKERSVIGAKALGRDDKEMLLPSTLPTNSVRWRVLQCLIG